jgi:acetyltransferase-like isoleucine patch superfamily enzyme
MIRKIKSFFRKLGSVISVNSVKNYFFRLGGVEIGKNVFIKGKTYIEDSCSIGNHVKIGSNCYLGMNVKIANNVVVLDNVFLNNFSIGEFSYVFSNVKTEGSRQCKIKIGKCCGVGTGTILDHSGNITVGDYVNFAGILNTHSGVKYALGGKSFFDSEDYRIYGDINIGSNTFIGYNVVINPGVNIGSYCIINSNVTIFSDIPDNSVIYPSVERMINFKNKEALLNALKLIKK